MANASTPAWPDLQALDLKPTTDALHLWSQVVGKVRMAKTPWVNHSWHVPLYVGARGFGTGPIPNAGPYDVSGGHRMFELGFDLFADALVLALDDGRTAQVSLVGQSVAGFHAETMRALAAFGVEVAIDDMPCELPGAIRFPQDAAVRAYDPEVARAYLKALQTIWRVLQRFRTRFVGKCSPIHLFWGSFDLAVTRFSSRAAPAHPGGAVHMPDAVAREAYCQEESSAGFWPGSADGPAFYAYAYPAPEGFAAARVEPAEARYDEALGEFLLPYAAVRASADPEAALTAFLQSTYAAAADLGHWDRAALERAEGPLGHPPEGS